MIRISSVETEVNCFDISQDSELIVVCSGQIAKARSASGAQIYFLDYGDKKHGDDSRNHR